MRDSTFPPASVTDVHAHLRDGFSSGLTLPLSFRISQLEALRQFLYETESDFMAALHKDLHKNLFEALALDLGPVTNDISYFLHNLHKLMRPRYVNIETGAPIYVRKQPLGVVLIFTPFNFPIQLALRPLVAAIAAGNAVCLKPSEICIESERYVSRLQHVLDSRVFKLVNGDAKVCEELLTLRWDHIIYTGNSTVARSVMTAAAKNLTPVTLELGGKNPAIVTNTADVEAAASSIVRTRLVNCGQFCLAPDYCLVDDSVYDDFVASALKKVKQFYTDDPKSCPAFGRMVSSRHLKRVVEYLRTTTGRVLEGGEYDDDAGHYFAPTIVEVTNEDDVLMKEEIFGPILPIFRVKSTEESLQRVQKGEKPLALYLFCQDKTVINSVLDRTLSGSVGVNDALSQVAGKHNFLGGVGESGMGRYGFETGFETLTHERPVLYSTPRVASGLALLNPDSYLRRGWLFEFVIRILFNIPFPGSGGIPWLEKMSSRLRYAGVVIIACVAIAIGMWRWSSQSG